MIGIITIGNKRKVVEGDKLDNLIESAKWLLNDPKSEEDECTLLFCEITSEITIKRPKKVNQTKGDVGIAP